MKVGDLVKPSSFNHRMHHQVGKVEVVAIVNDTLDINGSMWSMGLYSRVQLKYYDSKNIKGEYVISWESVNEWEVDTQLMREEKLKELGI